MKYLKMRLQEPSTWAGLGLVASQALAATGHPAAAIAAGVVSGLVAVLKADRAGA